MLTVNPALANVSYNVPTELRGGPDRHDLLTSFLAYGVWLEEEKIFGETRSNEKNKNSYCACARPQNGYQTRRDTLKYFEKKKGYSVTPRSRALRVILSKTDRSKMVCPVLKLYLDTYSCVNFNENSDFVLEWFLFLSIYCIYYIYDEVTW